MITDDMNRKRILLAIQKIEFGVVIKKGFFFPVAASIFAIFRLQEDRAARNRHIEAIKAFNNRVTVPPESWTNGLFYKYKKMAQWAVSEAEKVKIEKTPEVKF